MARRTSRVRRARVIDVPRRGYGAALAAGIRPLAAPNVLMADASDSWVISLSLKNARSVGAQKNPTQSSAVP
jgi:hypothetical protein